MFICTINLALRFEGIDVRLCGGLSLMRSGFSWELLTFSVTSITKKMLDLILFKNLVVKGKKKN